MGGTHMYAQVTLGQNLTFSGPSRT